MKLILTCFCYMGLFIITSQAFSSYVRQFTLNSDNAKQCLTNEFGNGTQLFVSYKINLYDTKSKQYVNVNSPTTGNQIDVRIHSNGSQIFHEQLLDRVEGYTGFNFQKDGNFTVCAAMVEYLGIGGDINALVDWRFSFFRTFPEYKVARDNLAKEDNYTDPGPNAPNMLWNRFLYQI